MMQSSYEYILSHHSKIAKINKDKIDSQNQNQLQSVKSSIAFTGSSVQDKSMSNIEKIKQK